MPEVPDSVTDTHDSLPPADSDDPNATPGAPSRSTALIATFNVLHGRRPRSYVDLEAYARTVATLGADVVALQEVDRGMLRTWRADMTELAARHAGGTGYFGGARRRWDTGVYGNALITTGEVASAANVRLPRLSWRNERRSAIVSVVRVGDEFWNVSNTHLSLDFRESERQLRFLLDLLGDRQGPTVLVGDFNRDPQQVEPIATEAGWTTVATEPTYPSWAPEKRIDFVLLRHAECLRTEVRSLPVSDHCAVVAELRPLEQGKLTA